MNNDMKMKVERLNELYSKSEMGKALTEVEFNEQRALRDELINYFKFAINKRVKQKDENLR